jgi:hypothetical protein
VHAAKVDRSMEPTCLALIFQPDNDITKIPVVLDPAPINHDLVSVLSTQISALHCDPSLVPIRIQVVNGLLKPPTVAAIPLGDIPRMVRGQMAHQAENAGRPCGCVLDKLVRAPHRPQRRHGDALPEPGVVPLQRHPVSMAQVLIPEILIGHRSPQHSGLNTFL